MKNTSVMVKVAFPEITEIRIGSALRLIINYYVKLNEISYEKIEEERLYELLMELPNVYKYKTVVNYSSHVLNSFIGINAKIKSNDFAGISEINEKSSIYGLSLIPITMYNYLNNNILKKLIEILLKNMNEKKLKTYIISINKEEYIDFFNTDKKLEYSLENALKVIEAIRNWLEYNMIVRVNSFYIEPETKNIIFPVRFSFLEKII